MNLSRADLSEATLSRTTGSWVMDDAETRKVLLDMSQPDFLHDPNVIATWIGAAVGILGVGIAIFGIFYPLRKQRNRKEITCQVRADSPVVSVNEEVKDRIKIEFDGQIVEEMSFVILKIWNSGDVSIKLGDYIDPITFNFGDRKVLDVSIVSKEPESLIKPEDLQKFLVDNKPLPQKEKRTITLPEFHVNSKKRTGLQDSLTLRVLLSGAEGSIRVEGRIDDGKIIESNLSPHLDSGSEPMTVRYALGKFNDYLQWYLVVLETLLTLRFLLKLIGADPGNLFAGFLYAMTAILLLPFQDIVISPSIHAPNQVFEFSTLIAMVIYYLIIYALRRIVRLLVSSPEEIGE